MESKGTREPVKIRLYSPLMGIFMTAKTMPHRLTAMP